MQAAAGGSWPVRGWFVAGSGYASRERVIKNTGPVSGVRVLSAVPQKLFLAGLVSLIEHINSAGAVDDLHLAGVERVRCV